VASGLVAGRWTGAARVAGRAAAAAVMGAAVLALLYLASHRLAGLEVSSGTNALNVSIILGIMALPTVVSVSEDALQAAGRELREGSYALGATRAETILKVVLPAASSGILAAVILGVMRVIGETMVVWMASGNAAQIPHPWYNLLQPVRTLTATIAGDMGEADHVTGSARYHVLFAMALALLTISFVCNLASEWVVRRARRKLRG
jgi:phosphate transport system permease protein